jgi:hypothetical protein
MEYFGYLASILIEFLALGLMVVVQYTHSSCFSISIFSAASGCDSIFTFIVGLTSAVGTVGYFKRVIIKTAIVLVFHPLFPFLEH